MDKRFKERFTTVESQEILRLYNEEKMGSPSIAKIMGVSTGTISYFLQKHKVKVRSNKENSRKFYADFNYFNVIDEPEKAYWLGFIYADGFITTDRCQVGISLHRSDKDHLEVFKKHINATYEVHDYVTGKSSYKENTPYSRIIIEHEQLKNDLQKHGVFERKSTILDFPTTVPDKLIYHWLRGYFDGDGSLSYNSVDNQYQIKIVGTKELLEGIQKLVGAEHLKLGKRYEDGKNNYSLEMGGHNKIIPILDKIYENSTVHLQRKYKRYMSLKTVVLNGNVKEYDSVNCGNVLRA